jgi:hypothetical protein
VKAEDLNFPQAEYSPEELPASIAQLAEFIKEDQVRSAVIANFIVFDVYGIKSLETVSMHCAAGRVHQGGSGAQCSHG